MNGLSLTFPLDIVEAIARRTAEILAEGVVSPWYDLESAARYLAIPTGRLKNATAAREVRFSRQGKAYTHHRDWLDEYALKLAAD
jgi:hypothetical protein